MKPLVLSDANVDVQRQSGKRTNSRCLWASYYRPLLELQNLLFCPASSVTNPEFFLNISHCVINPFATVSMEASSALCEKLLKLLFFVSYDLFNTFYVE